MTPEEIYFWRRFVKVDDCLLWAGKTHRGHGRVYFRGKWKYTHRLAWELREGPILNGLWVLHSNECPHKICASRKHLRLGTPQENVADMQQAGTFFTGSRQGENNSRHKLTVQRVLDIRNHKKSKGWVRKLAVEYGVTARQIYKIRAMASWTYLNVMPSTPLPKPPPLR